jgi:hypothetical protein
MTNIDSMELKNIDSEDISDILSKIERSFDFKFGRNELRNVKTFGELCDVIVSKLQYKDVQDCTSQQAFYKLRNAICDVQNISKERLSASTDLITIFPKTRRRQQVRKIERYLGFSLKILRPKYWITSTLVLIFLVFLVGLFFKWQIALSGIIVCILVFKMANIFGKELDLKTIGELAEKMTRENYLKSRRNPATVNKQEARDKIRSLFANDIDLPLSVLTREATFI